MTRICVGLWLAAVALAAASCADPCEELQSWCDACRDPHQKASCETLVVEASRDGCTQGVDSFKNVCK